MEGDYCTWDKYVKTVKLSRATDGSFGISIEGGSDKGQFGYVGCVRPSVIVAEGSIEAGDIILEVNGDPVAGYIHWDLICEIRRSGSLLTLCLVSPDSGLTLDLKEFLTPKYEEDTDNFKLSRVVRGNILDKTLPCTTRPPRVDEQPGVDYLFLTNEEFNEMDRQGLLLEKGMSGGYFFGTPLPEPYHPNMQTSTKAPGSGNLGRLPPGWEVSYDQYGQKYFINHNDGTTTWMDPRLVALQHHSAKNSHFGELPYGWEAVKSNTLGVYYIENRGSTTTTPAVPAVSMATGPPVYHHQGRYPLGQQGRDEYERCPPPVQSKWVDLDHPDKPLLRKGPRTRINGHSTVIRSHSSGSVNSQNSVKSSRSSKSEQFKNSVRIPDTKFHSSWTSAESNLSHSSKGKRTKGKRFKEYIIDVQPDQGTFSDQHSYSEHSFPGSTNKSSCSNISVEREPYVAAFSPAGGLSGRDPLNGMFTHTMSHINQRTSLQHPNLQPQQQPHQIPSPDNPMLSGYGSPLQPASNIISVCLKKTSKGFGFTLYGGDKSGQPILIKSVKPGTPADLQGGLVGGELLVRVNNEPVSHLSHSQVVQIFKAVPNGSPVHLELRRNTPNPKPMYPGQYQPPYQAHPSYPHQHTQQQHHQHPQQHHQRHGGAYLQYRAGYPPPGNMPRHHGNDNGSARSNGSMNSSPDLIPIFIDKGTNGFGFTIHQGSNGQRVKSIMDKARCYHLMEGDFIVQINGDDTQHRSHSEIVALLKSIPPHTRTLFLISRPAVGAEGPTSEFKRSDKRSKSFRSRASAPGSSVKPPVPPVPVPRATNYPTYHQIDVPLQAEPLQVGPTGGYPGNNNTTTNPLTQPRLPLTQQIDSNRISDHGSNLSGSERHRHFSGSDRLYRVANNSGSERLTNPYTSGSERFSERLLPPDLASYDDHQVALQRDNNGFGFRIIGGEEHGTPAIIGHVTPEGPAEGQLQIYDEIRTINGQNVMGAYHVTVIELIEQAASYQGRVTMLVRRYANPEAVFNLTGLQIPEPENARYKLVNVRNVTIHKTPEETLGFVIHSSVRDETFKIGQIVENTPAGRCKELFEGDIILAVEGTPITGLSHKKVVEMIKKSRTMVQLGVASQQLVTEEEEYNWEEETELVNITLERDEKGFGFSIRGGKAFQEDTLFILRIGKDGAADKDGRLRRGDEIIEINGESMKEVDHQEAVDRIKSGGGVLNLVVRRRKLEIPPIIRNGLADKPDSLEYPSRTEILNETRESARKGGDTPEKDAENSSLPVPSDVLHHEYDKYEIPLGGEPMVAVATGTVPQVHQS